MTRWLGLALVYVAAAHVSWAPGSGFSLETPHTTAGDEPHYLIIVHALLYERSLDLGPAYTHVANGGIEAGRVWQGKPINRHVILVDPESGAAAIGVESDFQSGHVASLGKDLALVKQAPAHPPLFPAILAAVLAIVRPAPEHLETWVGWCVLAIAFATLPLVFALARRAGASVREAWAAVLLVGLASPWLPYARSYFCEPAIGLCLVLGLLALQAGHVRRAALAASCAMAMKPLFVLVPVSWIVERAWQRQWRQVRDITIVCGVCGIALIAANLAIASTPLISGAEGWYFARGLEGALALSVSPASGVLVFATWVVVPIVLARGELARWALMAIGACMGLVALFGAAHGGYAYGPRYWVPFLPWLAVLAVTGVRDRSLARWLLAALAVLGAAMAIPGALQYHRLFSRGPWG